MTLLRWQRPEIARRNPWQQMSTLHQELNRMFENSSSPLATTQPFFGGWSPAIDLYENKDSFFLRAEVAGMKKEDLEITLHDGVLTVSGERKAEPVAETNETHRSERFFGRFQRSVTLPASVSSEGVTASYKDGVLTVTLPKAEEAKPRQINVHHE